MSGGASSSPRGPDGSHKLPFLDVVTCLTWGLGLVGERELLVHFGDAGGKWFRWADGYPVCCTISRRSPSRAVS